MSDKDEIVCVLTSNALCAFPATINSNLLKMTIDTLQESQAFLSSSSNDSVCKDERVSFNCYFTNGGSRYTFQWMLNGIDIPNETNGTFNTNSLKDNDIVQCRFTNGALCPVPVITSPINITLVQNHAPAVLIKANWAPGSITFVTTPVDAGSNPTFQWMRNYKDIPGETNTTFIATDLAYNDKITVKMRTDLPCTDKAFALSNVIVVQTSADVENVLPEAADIQLYPNPNKGVFAISYKGTHNSNTAGIAIVNITGQTVYQSDVMLQNGKFSREINVNNLVPGMYMCILSIGGQRRHVRFTVTD